MYESIVVGTDGSPTASKAVRHAFELAKLARAELTIVTGYDADPGGHLQGPVRGGGLRSAEAGRVAQAVSEGAETTLAQVAHEAAEAGLEVKTVAWPGDPARGLVSVAADAGADLIVVGNQGMRGGSRFLPGAVPKKVSHRAECSVLLVHTG